MLRALHKISARYERKNRSCVLEIETIKRKLDILIEQCKQLQQERDLFIESANALYTNGNMTINELREMRSAIGKMRRKAADIQLKIGSLVTEKKELVDSIFSLESKKIFLNKKHNKYVSKTEEAKSARRMSLQASEEDETEELGYGRTGYKEQH